MATRARVHGRAIHVEKTRFALYRGGDIDGNVLVVVSKTRTRVTAESAREAATELG